jgi:hypothetical protein
MSEGDTLIAVFFIGSMLSGVFVIFMAMKQRSESLERQHRERMAMIERGQIPPAPPPDRRAAPRPRRYRSASSSSASGLG